MNFIRLRCINKEKEVYHYGDSLCCFGLDDLNIMTDCNFDYVSYSELGNYYE